MPLGKGSRLLPLAHGWMCRCNTTAAAALRCISREGSLQSSFRKRYTAAVNLSDLIISFDLQFASHNTASILSRPSFPVSQYDGISATLPASSSSSTAAEAAKHGVFVCASLSQLGERVHWPACSAASSSSVPTGNLLQLQQMLQTNRIKKRKEV